MSILVVDDEAPVRTVVMAVLEETQYDVIGAANGRDAVACLWKNPERFQLVLLDLMMPYMSGWDVLHAMQAHPTLASIPVVIMTAGANVRQQALELGAAEYLSKPLDFDLLLSIAERLASDERQAGA
jgi:two-component system alkaline phosphatase synthesis response regulator PhoP